MAMEEMEMVAGVGEMGRREGYVEEVEVAGLFEVVKWEVRTGEESRRTPRA